MTTEVKKRGRPKKPEEKPAAGVKDWRTWKARAAEAEKRWGGTFVNAAEDVLHIDSDRIPPDMDLRWVRISTYNQPDPKNYAAAERNAYVKLDPADRREIDGCEVVEEGGLVLMARSRSIGERARLQERQAAAAPLEINQRRAEGGDFDNIPLDARHPTARRFNHQRKSVERIEIPQSKD
jgi:hypothetical protein